MEFMEKLGKQASKTCRVATQKTEKIAQEIKLKTRLSNYKDKIEDIYEEMGKQVYEKHILNEDIKKENFVQDCSEIDILAQQTENIRMELLSLKNLKQCENCHCEIALEYNYCPNCGNKQL